MNVVVYELETGRILRRIHCPPAQVSAQSGSGEEFYLNCPAGATHIIDGAPVTLTPPPPPPPTSDELLENIRQHRDRLLRASDWTQLDDYPGDVAKKNEWKKYRKTLRDFPETCDPYNPVWPVLPQ